MEPIRILVTTLGRNMNKTIAALIAHLALIAFTCSGPLAAFGLAVLINPEITQKNQPLSAAGFIGAGMFMVSVMCVMFYGALFTIFIPIYRKFGIPIPFAFSRDRLLVYYSVISRK